MPGPRRYSWSSTPRSPSTLHAVPSPSTPHRHPPPQHTPLSPPPSPPLLSTGAGVRPPTRRKPPLAIAPPPPLFSDLRCGVDRGAPATDAKRGGGGETRGKGVDARSMRMGACAAEAGMYVGRRGGRRGCRRRRRRSCRRERAEPGTPHPGRVGHRGDEPVRGPTKGHAPPHRRRRNGGSGTDAATTAATVPAAGVAVRSR